ncbi:meiotic cell cortex C-terminal pleckstrin homology-domain-containing protein [Mrakia frigida]|uniref:PH domain-containing protein n=1 Tax=Mrakia frigida TaxID=29902 RepID=UPI003FCC2616
MGLYRYDASTSSDGLPVQNGQRDLGAFFQQDSQDSAPTSPSDTTFPSLPQDRSRPPTFIIPPPPNMPPPAGITVRKVSMPPPRPLSPPPPEVYQRSITPVNGQRSNLLVPGQGSVRAMPPPNTSRPSISKAKGSQSSSFRSTSGGASRSMAEFGIQPTGGSLAARTNVRKKADFVVNSHASLASSTFSGRSHRDRAPSIDSSHSSEAPHSDALPQESMGGAATGPGGTTPSTDPQVIFAITQTMIGEFLYKYTRKTMGKGHSDKRHKRFFWVHPYTKTLYWSSADPGSTGTQESSAKSAYIESVRSVEDPNPMPPGIYHHSVIVSTPQREMKFTATSKERHDIWLNALQYLLARPTPETTNGVSEPSAGPFDTTPNANHYRGHSAPNDHDSSRPRIPSASPNSIRSFASASSNGTGNFHLTPKAKRSQSALSIAFSNHNGSVSKRNGTAAREYLEHVEHDNLQSPTKSMKAASFRSKASGNPYDRQQYEEQDEFEHIGGAEDADEDEEGYEGLDNVRACCGGIHDVGTLAGRRHIQTHHNHPPRSHSSASNHNSSSINHKRAATQPSSSSSQQTQLQGGPYSAASNSSAALDAEQDLPTRSISPSGFSLRSRGSRRSSASNGSQGVSSIFGKSSRSAKESSESNERTAAGGTIGKKGKGRPSLVERLTNSRAPSE